MKRTLAGLALILIVFGCSNLVTQAQSQGKGNHRPAHPLVASGPMLGHAGLRYASVWIQTRRQASLCLEYQLISKAEDISREPWVATSAVKVGTRCMRTGIGPAHTALFELDRLHEGARYSYRILLDEDDPEPVDGRPYPDRELLLAEGEFSTQPHWLHRYPAPDFTIAMGSCSYINDPAYDRPSPSYGGDYQIFDRIAALQPSAMLWLGDNTYLREGDWESFQGRVNRYQHTRATPSMANLLAICPQYAVWDDHDFGPNDATGSWPLKRESLEAFKLFWANPSCGMPEFEGISSAFRWMDVEVFLLDNRYHRNNQRLKDTCARRMLGDAQIEWLVDALKFSRAPFKLVASGSQILNSHAIHETYANYPCERRKLLDRLAEENIRNVIFLTGDRHHSEISKMEHKGVVFWDITSSPLTSGINSVADKDQNDFRIPESLSLKRGFATLNFSGPAKERLLTTRFHDSEGQVYFEYRIPSSGQ
ncbi:MAG: alkaline phosphatase D family protein [Bacteroidota bacterium]